MEITYEMLRDDRSVVNDEDTIRQAIGDAADPAEFVLTPEFTRLHSRLSQSRVRAMLTLRRKLRDEEGSEA